MPQTSPGSGSTPVVERVARPAMPPVVAASRASANPANSVGSLTSRLESRLCRPEACSTSSPEDAARVCGIRQSCRRMAILDAELVASRERSSPSVGETADMAGLAARSTMDATRRSGARSWQRKTPLNCHLIFTLTVFATLPSTVSLRSTSPSPARVGGRLTSTSSRPTESSTGPAL